MASIVHFIAAPAWFRDLLLFGDGGACNEPLAFLLFAPEVADELSSFDQRLDLNTTAATAI